MNLLLKAIQRDRAVVLIGAVALTALSWLELWRRAGAEMTTMGASEHTGMAWGVDQLAMGAVMWCVMMVAMMLPSAVPALLLYRMQVKGQAELADRYTALFGAGYLLVWFGWSLLAAALQWVLHGLALLTPHLAVTSSLVGALVLGLAGLYQFTAWKEACLTRCQSPADFLVLHWQHGPGGALRMGIGHGLFCVGCCWALMGVLFVAGIMNLAWVAALAIFVLLEKLVTRSPYPSRVGGSVLLLWAAYAAYQGITG